MHFLFQNQFSISNSGLTIHTFSTHNTLYGNEAVILLPLSKHWFELVSIYLGWGIVVSNSLLNSLHIALSSLFTFTSPCSQNLSWGRSRMGVEAILPLEGKVKADGSQSFKPVVFFPQNLRHTIKKDSAIIFGLWRTCFA